MIHLFSFSVYIEEKKKLKGHLKKKNRPIYYNTNWNDICYASWKNDWLEINRS